MRAKLLLPLLALLLLPLNSVLADSPLELIKQTITQIIKVNNEFDGEANTKTRRAKLREIINPHFDFAEMAKRSLGPQWTERTPEEQQEFVDVFSNLLARTYLERIDTLKSNIITYNKEEVTPPKALVKTTVTHKGDAFPIDYKLMNDSGSWRVYDVVIENIGLVANYRNEFAGIIRKEKFSGLMEKLKSKSAA